MTNKFLKNNKSRREKYIPYHKCDTKRKLMRYSVHLFGFVVKLKNTLSNVQL